MPTSLRKTTSTPALLVENLSVVIGEQTLLQDVSFRIETGSICAIIGPNGSGKTTLMRAMLRLLPPTAGQILFFGTSLTEWGGSVGYVPQKFLFDRAFPLTVNEFLTLACGRTCSHGHVREKLSEVGFPVEHINSPLGTLSGGQLQRVLIAQSIAGNPEVLFMDEPSTGIDTMGEQTIYGVLKHLNKTHGTTIVFISHDIGVVSEIVDQVVCINKSLLCQGTPKKTLTAKTLHTLYGGGDFPEHQHVHTPSDGHFHA